MVSEYCGLKVLHVANLSLLPKGAGYHGVAFKLSNGLTRLGCQVLNFSDRDEARGSTIFRSRKLGVLGGNRKLLDVVETFRPDVILFGHADTILPATLERIRELQPSVRLAQWNVDALFLEDNVRRLQTKMPYVDFTFASTAGQMLTDLTANEAKVGYLPNPVDLAIERNRNFEQSRQVLSGDVFLAAGNAQAERSHVGVKGTTEEIILRLSGLCPEARFVTPGSRGEPLAFGADYDQALAKCSMGLNLSRRNDCYLYSSDRLAHMIGNGMLVFVDRATGFADLFGEDVCVFYESEAELAEKIRHYVQHDQERQAMAERGWRRYVGKFDCQLVASYMLDVLVGRGPASLDRWCA